MNKYNIIAAFSFPRKVDELYQIFASRIIVSDFGKLNNDSLSILKYFSLKHITLIIINPDNSIEKEENIKNENINIIYWKHSDFFNSKNIIFFFSKVLEKQTNMFFIFKENNWFEILLRFRMIGIIVSSGSNNKKWILSPIQFKLALFAALFKGDDALKTIINSYFSKERLNFTNTQTGLDWTSKDVNKTLKEIMPENSTFMEKHQFPIKNIKSKST